ncbi:hypothetical protein ACG7TL_005653 [Trametes sanguinea]
MPIDVATDNCATPTAPLNAATDRAQRFIAAPLESRGSSKDAEHSPESESISEDDRPDGSTTVGSEEESPSNPPRHSSDSPKNTIWLIRDSLDSVESQLHLDCIYRGPGPFIVHRPLAEVDTDAASSSHATLHEILECYHTRIISMKLDASRVPNPEKEETMACPLELPLHPSPKPHDDNSNGAVPMLPNLTKLQIETSRKISSMSLLELLRATPELKTLLVKNHVRHVAVLPEELGQLPQVKLSHLRKFILDGVSADTANDLLSKLVIGTNVRKEISLNPACPSGPIEALRPTFATMREARLSCMALPGQGNGPDNYRLTFSDGDSRLELRWEWSVPHGTPPNLLHVSLDRAALRNVRDLDVSLRDFTPTCEDWAAVLRPFPSLRRLEVWDERSAPQHPSGYISERSVFRVRGAPLLNMVADVPSMFALGLSHHLGPSKATSGEHRGLAPLELRRHLWRCVVARQLVQ